MRYVLALVLVAALVLAGCVLRRGGSQEAPTLVPAPSPTASPMPQPTPSPTQVPPTPTSTPTPQATLAPTAPPKLFVRIANTGGLGANLRTAPETSAPGVVWPEGTVLEVVGEDRQGDGGTWKDVKSPSGQLGWMFASYLTPAEGATSVATAPPATPAPTFAAAALDVVATVQYPILQQAEQTALVKVTRGGEPVVGANVTFSAFYRGLSRNYAMPPTGTDGITKLTWNVEGAHGEVRLEVQVTAPDGATAHVSTGFDAR